MTICADGHTATPQDIQQGTSSISQAFNEAQAAGQLSKKYELSMPNHILGVADVGKNKIQFSTEYGACLSKNQTKAIMLHEAYHPQIPKSLGRAEYTCMIVNVYIASIIWGKLFRAAKTVFSKQKPPRRQKHPWRLVALGCTLTAVGYVNALCGSWEEKLCDLYASEQMGTAKYIESSLTALYEIQPTTPVSRLELVSTLPLLVMLYGPIGMFHTHPSLEKRIEFLEEKRPLIEKNAASQPERKLSLQ